MTDSPFGTGYDEQQSKTYRDLALAIKNMSPRDVSPGAYEDVLLMMETMQAFLTGENERLTQLGVQLSSREAALGEAEKRLQLEKRALGMVARSGDASLTHGAVVRDVEPIQGRGLWGRRSTIVRG